MRKLEYISYFNLKFSVEVLILIWYCIDTRIEHFQIQSDSIAFQASFKKTVISRVHESSILASIVQLEWKSNTVTEFESENNFPFSIILCLSDNKVSQSTL